MARPASKTTKPAPTDALSADIALITGEAVSTIPTTAGRATKPVGATRGLAVKPMEAGPGEVIITCVSPCAIASYGIVMSAGERRVIKESDSAYLIGTGNFVLDNTHGG